MNELASDGKTTPYSMVTAMDPPPASGMEDDHIIVTQWLAEDLDLQVGDSVTLTYWVVGEGRQLIEQQATFNVHAIVPTSGEKIEAFYKKVITSTPPEVVAFLKEMFP